ncbi:MAG: tetratricopeptide repeat protein [Chitinophagaceae bacterium]|nr:tetratricopeptide repeat protein [Chitinophagaceae bacterium]
MTDKKNVQESMHDEIVIAKVKNFWTKYSNPIMIASAVIILVVGGWYIYQNFFKNPKETKATEIMFKAEEYYRLDSANLALNGDGQNWGFLKIIDKYGGTKAGNLANFYAGDCYIKLNENEKAIKYLKKFSGDSKPVQARAYKLMADAYAELGKNADALNYYKKAAHHFEKDATNSAEYLFYAAYLADRVLKDPKEAIALYKELKEKFPKTNQGQEADNYLAQLGVYNTEN